MIPVGRKKILDGYVVYQILLISSNLPATIGGTMRSQSYTSDSEIKHRVINYG